MIIKELSKSEYEGHLVEYKYQSESYYECVIEGMSVTFKRKNFKAPVDKYFSSTLFKQKWNSPSAYGCFVRNRLVGLIEIDHLEKERIRVTNLTVHPEYRRRGVAKALMSHIKKVAQNDEARAIILETQTFNTKAIDFYLSENFEFGGFDSTCYSNEDIMRNEVRIELVYRLNSQHTRK